MIIIIMFSTRCEQQYELCIPLVVFGFNSLIRLFTYFFSAGVGRSGAYIVIHSMVKRMHVTGDINVFDFLSQIRQQRNHLVQEEVSRALFKCKSNLKPCFHPCCSDYKAACIQIYFQHSTLEDVQLVKIQIDW